MCTVEKSGMWIPPVDVSEICKEKEPYRGAGDESEEGGAAWDE